MSILSELEARGLVNDVTDRDEITKKLESGSLTFYIGFDPTADTLHAGSLLQVVTMARLSQAGHKPIALVGGATGMVGDPSGRSDERNLLDEATLANNVAGIRAQLELLLGPACKNLTLVNNADWFRPIGFLEFLRDVGKHLTVNYMTAKESVRSRLEDRDQGISYTEFSYMLLQAYDFYHLATHHGCQLQVGGSDQWGNITAGIELSRKLGGPKLWGLTTPLLLDSKGQKMGKTASGTKVWLDPKRTSPYAFYQYWLNVDDVDVGRLLRIFSWRSLSEIAEIESSHTAEPHKRLGQRALAEDVTDWVHGKPARERAIKASQVMFGGTLDDLRDADLAPLLDDVPSSELGRDALESGIELTELMVRTELANSKGAARRLITGGGVYINNHRVADPATQVNLRSLGTETMIVLRAGKKNYHIVKMR